MIDSATRKGEVRKSRVKIELRKLILKNLLSSFKI